MTDDPQFEAERRILSSLASSITQTARQVADVHGLPVEATACSLISAACFLIESAHGKPAMLEWLSGQLEGQRSVPGELNSKLN